MELASGFDTGGSVWFPWKLRDTAVPQLKLNQSRGSHASSIFFFHILLLQGGVVFPWRFIIISVNRDLKVPLPLTFFNFGI